jgi:hypothetical protein
MKYKVFPNKGNFPEHLSAGPFESFESAYKWAEPRLYHGNDNIEFEIRPENAKLYNQDDYFQRQFCCNCEESYYLKKNGNKPFLYKFGNENEIDFNDVIIKENELRCEQSISEKILPPIEEINKQNKFLGRKRLDDVLLHLGNQNILLEFEDGTRLEITNSSKFISCCKNLEKLIK